MAATALNLDLSGIAVDQLEIPDPIANAFVAVQATMNNLGNVHIASDAAIAQSKLLTTKLAYAERTSNVTAAGSNGGTKVDITDATITFTPDGTRNVLVIGFARLYNQSAADTLSLHLIDSATVQGTVSIYTPGANTAVGLVAFKYYAAPAASAKTVKLQMSTAGLTGGINCEAAATTPAFIMAIIL